MLLAGAFRVVSVTDIRPRLDNPDDPGRCSQELLPASFVDVGVA